ncbi:MAG: PilZ domain-containing protein [Pseudomonadales bacterium]
MHVIEKRDYYRISDDIYVSYQVVRRSDLKNSGPDHHFNLAPSFMMLPELFRLDIEAQSILRTINEQNKELGSFLHNLNQRISALSRAIVATEDDVADASRVKISEGGISFITSELLSVSTPLALKLLINCHSNEGGPLGLTCFGEVRHCRLREDGKGDHNDCITGVRFINLDPVSQNLISRHIIRRQAQARRERLRHDRHS